MLLWISLVLAGVSLCVLVYVVLSPGLQENQTSVYFTRWSWIWPWVRTLSYLIRPFYSWKYQKNLEQKIQLAAYDGYLSIEDMAGLQGLGAIVVVGIGFFALYRVVENEWVLFFLLVIMLFIGAYLPIIFLKKKAKQRQSLILKAFPFFLDMMTLCVESGSNLQAALIVATQTLTEGPLCQEIRHALSDMRTGTPRMEALKSMAVRCGVAEVRQWVASLIQAESLGASLGSALRAQSDQFRNERFLRAEKLAAEAPVKLLFPLVVFIFPCTFLVIGYPLVMRFTELALW